VRTNDLLNGGFGWGWEWSYRWAATMSEDAGERLVAGRWTLHTPLRRAVRGVLWRATEVAAGTRLAVEQLRLPERADPAGPSQAALWSRVAAEARAGASLTAPALVRLDDVVVEDGVVYVATELVEAIALDELVARHGPLPPRRVAQLGLELLDAIEAAHAAGLAPLDLRPANVLITPDGHARLAGVGQATLRTRLLPLPSAPHLAPEQLRGDPAGPPADLWSLGSLLTLAATGEGPFAGSGGAVTNLLDRSPGRRDPASPLAPALRALLTGPPGGRPTIAETRRLLEPLAGGSHRAVPGATDPPGPGPGPSEGERSRPRAWARTVVHNPLGRLRAARDAMDPVAQRVLLIAGGSVLLALVSFAVAVAVTGDPLGLRSEAVAPTAATVPTTTLPPTTTAPPTTIPPSTTAAPVVPPGWSVHSDPATGYQVALPPGWQVVSDGGSRTELHDQSSPTFLRIDTQQDPQADPLTLEQQASQAHAGEHGGYAPARLEPAQFKGLPAALLEFTYQDGETWHALELGIRTPRHHVAMAIYARDRDWGTGWALFEAFKASLVPPPA
jgi:eukaryotic-like serine/threonine-protein kinase